MTTTALVIRNNRIRDRAYMDVAVAAVAVDAQSAEIFTLPSGFGDLWMEHINVQVSGLSGDQVASTDKDGMRIRILSSDATQVVDSVGSVRFVGAGGTAARPNLNAYIELYRFCLVRQGEQIQCIVPVLAGAGVTATVTCSVRGIRMKQA